MIHSSSQGWHLELEWPPKAHVEKIWYPTYDAVGRWESCESWSLVRGHGERACPGTETETMSPTPSIYFYVNGCFSWMHIHLRRPEDPTLCVCVCVPQKQPRAIDWNFWRHKSQYRPSFKGDLRLLSGWCSWLTQNSWPFFLTSKSCGHQYIKGKKATHRPICTVWYILYFLRLYMVLIYAWTPLGRPQKLCEKVASETRH